MSSNLDDMVPVAEAAEILGCTPRRIQQLLKREELLGRRVTDHFWLVDLRSLKRYANKPQTMGRPRISATPKES